MTAIFFLMGFAHLLLFFQPSLATEILDIYLRADSMQNAYLLSQTEVIEMHQKTIVALIKSQKDLEHSVNMATLLNAALLVIAGFLFLEKEYHTAFFGALGSLGYRLKNIFTFKRKNKSL